MNLAPIIEALVAFALVKSELFVNFVERQNAEFGCSENTLRNAFKIRYNAVTIHNRLVFGLFLFPKKRSGRRFLALQN